MSSKKTEYNEWSLLLIFILAALFLGLSLAIFYHILLHIRQKLEARRRYLQEQRKTQSKLDKQVAKKNFIDQIEEIKDRQLLILLNEHPTIIIFLRFSSLLLQTGNTIQ